MAAERFLLKDMFDVDSVGRIADAIARALPGFDATSFLGAVFDEQWPDRELKQRMRHIATLLHGTLPGSYREQLSTLLDAVPHTPGRFPAMVYSDFVEAFGTGDWDASVPALERFTTLVSAEFAVRPFIAESPARTLAQMLEWAHSGDPAVRRLATEGCRPRLPWGRRLHALVEDPSPVIPILDRLRDDPDEAVRRSVANNLNDISKDHPDLVVGVLRRWLGAPTERTAPLARHALRTLLKAGHPGALDLMGFATDPAVCAIDVAVTPGAVEIGGTASLSFTLVSTGYTGQRLMVDYALHYLRADGASSRKVFKLKTLTLAPGRRATLTRPLRLRQMSTRTLRPGTHRVEVMANGVSLASVAFEVFPGPV